MSLASYEAPALPFAGLFFAALLVDFEPFEDPFEEPARDFFSAKNALPFVRENPERRWLLNSRETGVGASVQVDIKDTSQGPWNNRTGRRKTLQITNKSVTCRGLGDRGRHLIPHSYLAG